MSEETELIKERLDVASVVGEYVPLKRAGQSLKGLCPFHQEKTPSFIVSPNRNTWHCFGCNESGDIFSFIQKIEGLDFPGALKMLAERAGVQLKTASRESTNRRQRLFDLLNLSTQLYHEILMNQGTGRKAKKYLGERGVTSETMKQFRIGYAPDSWDTLQRWLAGKNFTTEEMTASGAVGRSQTGKLYDRFRGRIIFPIADTQGRTVGFGGRIVPWLETGNEGKYINSPEGAMYEKRRVVYNLDRAKKVLRADAPCVVVEGYMDAVLLSQIGVENVVATSGTAFTVEQVEQLKRFTNTLHFAFDADAAGFKAGVAATGAALAAGLKVATIVMPAGSDPADLALADARNMRAIIAKPQSLIGVLLGQLKESAGDNQEQQLKSLVPLVKFVTNPIQQGSMVQEAARALHIPEERVIEMVRQAAERPFDELTVWRPLPAAFSDGEGKLPGAPGEADRGAMSEQQLLGLFLLEPDVRVELFEAVRSEYFLDGTCIALYNSMQQLQKRNSSFLSMQVDEVVGALAEDQIPFAEGVRAQAEELLETTSNTPLQESRLLIYSLRRRWLKNRLMNLQAQLFRDVGQDNETALQEFQLVTEELAHIDA